MATLSCCLLFFFKKKDTPQITFKLEMYPKIAGDYLGSLFLKQF
jgi:hypothetical protein